MIGKIIIYLDVQHNFKLSSLGCGIVMKETEKQCIVDCRFGSKTHINKTEILQVLDNNKFNKAINICLRAKEKRMQCTEEIKAKLKRVQEAITLIGSI